MTTTGLIGGADLKNLVTFGRPDKNEVNRIYIDVDEERIHPGERILDQYVTLARTRIQSDFDDKSRAIDSFVSLRIHVGAVIWRVRKDGKEIDLNSSLDYIDTIYEKENKPDGFVLEPGEFVLCRSVERIWLPSDVYAYVQSRTTMALRGVDVTPTHVVVPGFRDDSLFLEVSNRTKKTMRVPRLAPLAEILLHRTERDFKATVPQFKQADAALENSAPRSNEIEREVFKPIVEHTYDPVITAACVFILYRCWRFGTTIQWEEGIKVAVALLLIGTLLYVRKYFCTVVQRYLNGESRTKSQREGAKDAANERGSERIGAGH